MATRAEVFAAIASADDYQLALRATALKKAGDLAGAIEALRQRKRVQGNDYEDTRLAKFLQAAGQFDEAMVEMKELFESNDAWASRRFAHQPASVVLRQKTIRAALLHKDAALLCRRAGKKDLQQTHRERSEKLFDLVRKLDPVAEADQKAIADSWKTALQIGRAAMDQYFADRESRIAKNKKRAAS